MRTAVFAVGCLLATAGPASAGSNNGGWRDVGTGPSPVNVTGEHGTPPGAPNIKGVAIENVRGVPHVAWSEWNGTNFQVHVAKLAGGAWQPVGGGIVARDPSMDAVDPDLATTSSGALWITWTERALPAPSDPSFSNFQEHAARLVGARWQEVGSGPNPVSLRAPGRTYDSLTSKPKIAFVRDRPYIVFLDGVFEQSAAARRLAAGGQSWESVSNGLREARDITGSPALGVVAGRLYYAFRGYSPGGVLQLNDAGDAWIRPGGDSAPMDAWGLAGIGSTVYTNIPDGLGQGLGQLSGGTWQNLGGGFGGETLTSLDGLLYGGEVTVPASEQGAAKPASQLVVNQRDPSEPDWRVSGVVGGQTPPAPRNWPAGFANIVSPAITTVGALPYIAWAEYDGSNYEVRVARRVASQSAPPPCRHRWSRDCRRPGQGGRRR
jgi:hypothetical protein